MNPSMSQRMSVILQCTRRSIAPTLCHSRRGLTTASDAAGQTMSDTFSTLNSIMRASAESSQASTSMGAPSLALHTPSPPRQPTTSKNPPAINIPPVEDPLLHYITSCIQKHGERQKAARCTAQMLLHLHTLTRAPPLPLLRKAIFALSPAVRNITNKHAGRSVVYPIPLSEKQRTRFAVKWLLKASEDRPGQQLEVRLAKEIVKVLAGKGEDRSAAFRQKEEVHKFAMNNRGNAMRN
ncbi:mitochondrial ribosomal protein S5/S7 [Amylocystis lapponica]|nr:mitochondrial ribosomal protein S5/S7 [Amylocystis lapponica]